MNTLEMAIRLHQIQMNWRRIFPGKKLRVVESGRRNGSFALSNLEACLNSFGIK